MLQLKGRGMKRPEDGHPTEMLGRYRHNTEAICARELTIFLVDLRGFQ